MSMSMPEGFEVGKLTIPIFIGTVVNWALFGALAVQVYLYFLAFPKDHRSFKSVVLFIFLAEILQTLGDSRDTVVAFGSGWGNPNSLDKVGWVWFSVPIIGSTIASVGQLFFAWRISIIGHTLYIPVLIAAITAVQFGAGIWTGVLIVRAGRFSLLNFDRLKPPVAWLAATAACDLVIVFATVFYMLRARQTEFKTPTQTNSTISRTNSPISRIVRLSVETGVLCAVSAIAILVIYVVYDGNNYHLGICIWLSKVYSNSMMVIFNSRAYFGHAVPQSVTGPIVMVSSEIAFAPALHLSIETDHSRTVKSSAVDSDKDFGHTVG
ncbi:hypothetical protein K438DRAFT_1888211 [Mycena galopus ATCC 62051]|nr:hypothetical protein K438DRAFT_1888211 [Mycena galopus ATCC 62051]